MLQWIQIFKSIMLKKIKRKDTCIKRNRNRSTNCFKLKFKKEKPDIKKKNKTVLRFKIFQFENTLFKHKLRKNK